MSSSGQNSRPKRDAAWEHCVEVIEGTKKSIKCLYCQEIYKGGGINRIKHHLAGKEGNVKKCDKVPFNVRYRMQQSLKEFEESKKQAKNVWEENPFGHFDGHAPDLQEIPNPSTAPQSQVKEKGLEISANRKRKASETENFFTSRATLGAQLSIKNVLAEELFYPMEVLSFVGSSLLSVTQDLLSDKFKEYISDQPLDSKEEVRAQMESWKALLPKIIVVLQHAEENQVANLFVKLYFDDLRVLAYDLEDILEKFVINAKRSELIAEFNAGDNMPQNIAPSVMNLFRSEANSNQEIDSMVRDLSGRLQKIENGMHNLDLTNLALKFGDRSHKIVAKRLLESSLLESSLLEDKVWGRRGDKDAILRTLLEDGGSLEQDFVIPIVGMGGLGKTTLARLIYNDEKLKSRFDLKAWVCVSDEFDVAQITRTILEHVTRKRCNLQSFTLLQEELKGELSGHKFLLVLDDVWNKEYD